MIRAILLTLLALLVAVPRVAWGQTLVAPAGARPVPLGETRVACGQAEGGWVVDASGHAVRPPATPAATPTPVTLKVAPAPGECAASTASVKLLATPPWPVIDSAATTLSLDEERLELRGKNLQGASVAWASERESGSDICRDPRTEGGVDVCTLRVPRTLSADPVAGALRWLPAGAPSSDAEFFGADGKPVAAPAFALLPAKVEVKQLAAPDASVDVSGGVGLLQLLHPEVVAGVECGAVKCTLENGNLAVQAPPAAVTAIDVKVRLLPHVFLMRKNAPDPTPTLRVPVLRCPMEVASGPALRNLDGARVVVHLAGACAKNVRSLNFFVGTRRVDVIDVEVIKDAAYAVLALGNVDAPSIAVTATRDEGDGAAVAFARVETTRPPIVRTVLEIPGFPAVDFVPSNRTAIVHFPKVHGAELTLLPVENVYVATHDGSTSRVQGDPNAAGSVTLQFAYRVPTLPSPLDQVDLGVVSDSLQRSVKEANVPAPFGLSASTSPAPLAEVVCTEDERSTARVEPGVTAHVPFRYRDSCRVILHRERLSPEYGTQKMVLTIDVNKIDGSSRAEAHVDQTFVMRAGAEPRIAWIKGIGTPYDRVIVKLSHAPDESHYLGATELIGAAPIAQWTMIFGTGRVRLYATTAIPTGLYRFGDSNSSGVMSLSFGVISRFTWLDTDGKEGLLALEGGVMAFGLTGDNSSTGTESLTQVGAVAGVGIAIPIANAGAATQASINLHLWGEQRLTGSGPSAGSEQAIIFGPSISIGNVGTTF